MQLRGDRLRISRDGRPNNPWRVLAYAALITVGLALVWLRETGRVRPLFLPAYTPTRTAQSFAEQGRAYFSAGNLAQSIEAYQAAAALEPENGLLWAELARIQTYSSALMTTAEDGRGGGEEGRASTDRGAAAAPGDRFVF